MPFGSSVVVFVTYFITQDTALFHSCVDSKQYRQTSIVDLSAAGVLIKAVNDVYDFLKTAIV